MRYFEDLPAGTEIDLGAYLLTVEESVELARRWEPQPFHIDAKAAARSMFGGLTSSSLHLFAIATRLFFDLDPAIAVLAMLGKDEVRLPRPVRPPQTIRYSSRVESARASSSKPDRGVIVLADTLSDEAGETVLSQKVSLLVSRRPSR